MDDYRTIRALMYFLVNLTLILVSCGGEPGGNNFRGAGAAHVIQIGGVNESSPVLRTISISPNNPLGINPGARLQFAATGIYSDNSVQDLTMMVVWTSSDDSIAKVSNAPMAKGRATAVSMGYCSISATLDRISGSTIIGVKGGSHEDIKKP
jgi:hypothetical protein